MSRPDQCDRCGSLNYVPLKPDGRRFNPFADTGLWTHCLCDECGHVWPFRIVKFRTEPLQVAEVGHAAWPSRSPSPRWLRRGASAEGGCDADTE